MSKKQQPPTKIVREEDAKIIRPVQLMRPQKRRRSRKVWLVVGAALLLSSVLLAVLLHSIPGQPAIARDGAPHKKPPITPLATFTATGIFQGYRFPRADNQPMRPAIDHQGRIWFGAMDQNALVVFDPHTQIFQYLTPPHGRHGIMGVQVASDDTIWFTEQFANYIGHYFPTTGNYVLYPLPWLTQPDSMHPGRTISIPSAPNELAIDGHGQVWFTEFNADRLGRLNPQTGSIQQYALATKPSVETLYPYGMTIDAQNEVWFTESGTNRLGRLDPATGTIRLFTAPDPHALLMEIASDAQGNIWVTSFTPGSLFRLNSVTGQFTAYMAPAQESQRSTFYGLLVTPQGEIWVTMLTANMLARVDVATRHFFTYQIPPLEGQPLGLAMDANHTLWFTGAEALGTLRF